MTLQLGAAATGQGCPTGTAGTALPAGLPWLQGKWGAAAAFDQNSAARLSYGQYKAPPIFLRQIYRRSGASGADVRGSSPNRFAGIRRNKRCTSRCARRRPNDDAR